MIPVRQGEIGVERLDTADYMLKFTPMHYIDEHLDEFGFDRGDTMRLPPDPVYLSTDDVEQVQNQWEDGAGTAAFVMKDGNVHVFWGDEPALQDQFAALELLVAAKRLVGDG